MQGDTDINLNMLRRVIPLLLALAVLAERAAVRSPAIRAAVLWLLRPAEPIAGGYLARVRGTEVRPAPWPDVADDTAAGACRLAASFRAIAGRAHGLPRGIPRLDAWRRATPSAPRSRPLRTASRAGLHPRPGQPRFVLTRRVVPA